MHRPAGLRAQDARAPGERRDVGEGRRGVQRPLRGARRGARQLAQRLPGAGALDRRGRRHPQDSEAAPRLVLPRGPDRALLQGGPGARRGGGRDVRHGDIDAQGGGRRGRARREVDVEVAGVAPVRVPGRRGGRVQEAALRRGALRLPVARRHLREVPRGGALGVPGRRDRDRARRHGPQALRRRGLRGHGEPRRVEAFLSGLRARGVDGVRLVVSDAHEGLAKAIAETFQGGPGSAASAPHAHGRRASPGRTASSKRTSRERHLRRQGCRPRAGRATKRRPRRC